jgi:hypothetical protein
LTLVPAVADLAGPHVPVAAGGIHDIPNAADAY